MLHPGCACFVIKVEDIARAGKHQHLIIESTGISDPTPVAEAFVTSDGSSNESSIYADAEGSSEEDDERGGIAVLGRGAPYSAFESPSDIPLLFTPTSPTRTSRTHIFLW